MRRSATSAANGYSSDAGAEKRRSSFALDCPQGSAAGRRLELFGGNGFGGDGRSNEGDTGNLFSNENVGNYRSTLDSGKQRSRWRWCVTPRQTLESEARGQAHRLARSHAENSGCRVRASNVQRRTRGLARPHAERGTWDAATPSFRRREAANVAPRAGRPAWKGMDRHGLGHRGNEKKDTSGGRR